MWATECNCIRRDKYCPEYLPVLAAAVSVLYMSHRKRRINTSQGFTVGIGGKCFHASICHLVRRRVKLHVASNALHQ